MNLVKFLQKVALNGGGSYCLVTGDYNPDNGYMVSISKEQIHPELSSENLRQFISDNIIDLFRNDRYIGIWENGGWVYDVSINVADLEEAKKVGISNNQKAIWDCKNGREIFL